MSREEAIKMLNDIGKYLCGGNPVWDTNKVAEAIRTAIVDMRMMPKYLEAFKAQKIEQWIPVSERLPEPDDNTYYLVSQKDYDWLAIARYATYSNKNVWDDDEGVVVSEHVTAYMPLPQPYKEEQNNAHHGSNDSNIRSY